MFLWPKLVKLVKTPMISSSDEPLKILVANRDAFKPRVPNPEGNVNTKATKKTLVFQRHRQPNFLVGWNSATLYSPALSRLVDRMDNFEFEPSDLLFAFEMAASMSSVFDDENETSTRSSTSF